MTEPPATRPSPIALRLAAAVVDFTLVVVVVLPIQLTWTETTGTGSDRATLPTSGANWLALALIAAYPIVCIAVFGATAGKRLFSLEVIGRGGRAPGWTAATVRFVVSIAPFLTGPLLTHVPDGAARVAAEIAQVLLMLGIYAPILSDPNRRGIHDRAASTSVVCRVPAMFRDGPTARSVSS